MDIVNFKEVIEVNGSPIEFDFVTMNIRELKLFQVYFQWGDERAKRRIHLQLGYSGNFYITDKDRLPDGLELPEHALSTAILTKHNIH